MGRSLRIVDECSSTNDVVGKLAENGAVHGLVVIAESQTAGRGRQGRTWCSPTGGIWLSILVRPHKLPSSISVLPLVGALGITETISENLKVNARVRWPNDVMVDDRKIAGVLVESKSKGDQLLYAVMGLGINANCNTSKIESIGNSSTSLLAVLGEDVSREDLICTISYRSRDCMSPSYCPPTRTFCTCLGV
jgi:BirA family biotin operon repressor/biotin-[acetyl-CoA-carboxylase] ligase